mmetsp:Transcript_24431/g.71694  ORF Transcript_24431/g.71694 Transcript_24431/m.71694 type:complete len:85 (-) Transcript_24431:1505-1759(-)
MKREREKPSQARGAAHGKHGATLDLARRGREASAAAFSFCFVTVASISSNVESDDREDRRRVCQLSERKILLPSTVRWLMQTVM